MEKRYPRESFTKKLVRMCLLLDEAAERVVEFKDFLGEIQTPTISVTSLWVVGSYARGAVECGDLDMVIQYAHRDGWEPSPRQVNKAFFGVLPLLRLYKGTPEQNASGVEFSEPVLIWSGPGCNWQAAIDAIAVDHHAGRAPRETDCIPLRNEQLRAFNTSMEDVAQMMKEGLLESEFVPFDSLELSELSSDGIYEIEQRFVQLGKKSRELLPAILRLMSEREPLGEWHGENVTTLRYGGTQLRLGTPELNVSCFDDNPAIRQLALIPHRSARGPNGAWILRRGPSHPAVLAISNRYAYVSLIVGAPDLIHASGGFQTVRVVELMSTEKAVLDRQKVWAVDAELSEQFGISRVEGLELLCLISSVDVVETETGEFAITWSGASYLEEYQITPLSELIASLPMKT
ncbi:hypothetical protein [Pseudomonas sediminis]|uniref:hypothetical protein n=1 Tax=Pseudomonas sediminis TaxID=1691904 RepID=UPI0031CCB1A3